MAQSHKRKDSPEALQERLTTITRTFSLSEIARRTETPLTNVHRYAGGSRIPAEFCAALVTRMGVNPGWLLAGEGLPWTSDITAGTTSMAGDLLELVEAMNAVTRMRLGALTGKHHLGVLRQLNDALVHFEDLRIRMNSHAEPVYRKLLDDLQKALARMDVDRAEEIARAAVQVARLCREPELERRHTRLKAHYAYLRGDHDAALAHQQESFRAILGEGVIAAEPDLEEAARLVTLLGAAGRSDDGLRLGEAAMLLAGEAGTSWPTWAHLACLCGNLMVETGRLYEGLALLKRWFPQVQGEGRQRAAQDSLTMALLYAGLMSPDEAFDYGGHNEFKAINLVMVGVYMEDADYLRRAFDYLEGGRVPREKVYTTMHYVLEHGRRVLDALHGEGRFSESGGSELEARIFDTQSRRLLGGKAQARKALAQAEKLVESSRNMRVMPLIGAVHYRNLLELSPRGAESHQRAVEYFEARIGAGYDIFRPRKTRI
ncbi:MAG: hypothetical protein K8I27_07630 [Planctomycetes bacterium]|nr:hypothetical protein [Planctomycetota bacterium]